MLTEIVSRLWVGNQDDYEAAKGKDDWSYVLAARDPWHRQLLGYTTKGAPVDNPEYLVARRGQTLYLNLIDAPSAQWIPSEVIELALAFIRVRHQEDKRNVGIFCNQGQSRAPSLALLYIMSFNGVEGNNEILGLSSVISAVGWMKYHYLPYAPKMGMIEVIERHGPVGFTI